MELTHIYEIEIVTRGLPMNQISQFTRNKKGYAIERFKLGCPTATEAIQAVNTKLGTENWTAKTVNDSVTMIIDKKTGKDIGHIIAVPVCELEREIREEW